MSARLRTCSWLFVAGLSGSIAACFGGSGTIGAVCFADNQCGLDQTCTNSICGQCNDRVIQPGELCFGNSSEENVFGEVADLLAYDPEGDGFPLLLAMVNNNCLPPPMQGPPTMGQPACWDLYALLIDDDGDFEAMTPLEDTNDGRVPQLGAGNFDGVGVQDIAMAVNPNDPLADPTAIAVVFNLFGSPQQVFFDISVQARTLHAADMNGDGLDDLLVGGEASSALVLFLANPSEAVGFDTERLLVTDPAPRPAAPVDMDNDGDLDVVLLSATEGTLGVDLNDGSGNLSAQSRVTVVEGAGLTAQEVDTADFDQDGNVDAVVYISAGPAANQESEVRVYRGLGDGTFELDQTLPGGEFPVSGLAEDVNHDGWVDIVVADIQEDKLPVHINRQGEFPDIVNIDVAAAPQRLMYADFDFDDIPDLVVGNANGVVAVVPSEN